MLRYYVIATVIVLAAAVLATAWDNRDRIRDAVASPAPQSTAFAPTTSPHAGFEPPEGAGGAPVRGDAPWALSALPDCLIQRSEATGPLSYVRSKVPRGAVAVAAGSTLQYGPCTIFVRDGEAFVSRGADQMHIPPRVTLYRTGGTLALLRVSGNHGDLRIYSPPRNER